MAEGKPFDELWGSSRTKAPRLGFEPLAAWLRDTPAAELERRQHAAEAAFRSLGITFSVYGEEEAAERIIPFDIVPRIFSAAEWARLSAGLEQRVRAINAFIDDVYGARKILADGIVPADIVLTNPQYCIPCAGARPPHGVYAHICGIDLIRTGPDEFYVLEDNARTPSGVSYMIENRDAMLRLCPELFDIFPVRPVDSYPEALRETLYSVAPPRGSREPRCVLLTPGHHNSAFYEHSFLADNMGIELVEGTDLVVDDDKVWMKTIDGPVQVDVIYRRIDDAFLDPLVFRADSLLGVPGLMAAYLAGNVTLVNAPGTGIADDKAIYSYMPEIVRYYTGEEAKLPNVETWRCRDPAGAAPHARQSRQIGGEAGRRLGRLRHAGRADRLEEGDRGLPRPAEGAAGALHRPADPAAVDRADPVRERPRAAPRRFPPVRADRRERRHHRPRRPHPGRAAQRLAGGQFEPGRRHQGQLRPLRRRRDQGRALMLSRTAASLYWIGRYMERAEFTTRLVEATIRLAALGGHAACRAGLAQRAQRGARAAARRQPRRPRRAPLPHPQPGQSELDPLLHRQRARQCPRRAHRAHPRGLGSDQPRLADDPQPHQPRRTSRRTLSLVEELKAELRGFEGALARMLRNEGYWFMRLGSMIERGDATARLLDVKYYLLLPEGQEVGGALDRDQWQTILQIVSAKTAYRHLYREALKPWLVADMLIFRRELPRSLAWTAEETVDLLGEFGGRSGRQGPADRLARQRLSRLQEAEVDTIFRGGLHEWLHAYIRDNNAIGAAIAAQFRFRLSDPDAAQRPARHHLCLRAARARDHPAAARDAGELRRPERARLADRRRLRRAAARGPRRLRQRHPHALCRQAGPPAVGLGQRAGADRGSRRASSWACRTICRRRSSAARRR